MSDILALQEFLFNGLLSCDLFAGVNVVQERKFLAQNELEFNSIWQAPRVDGGPVGVGLYVEMPKLEIPKPNSLQRHLLASIGVIEERNMNMTAGTGTGMSAEELAELALDFMFGWLLGLSSGLTPEAGAVRPAPDLVQGEGLVVYRAAVSMRQEHRATARCEVPTLTQMVDGKWQMANGSGTADAEIYYTLDGTFPGKSNLMVEAGAPGAVLYTEPIALQAGDEILFCAWRGDRLPSHIIGRVIT